MEQEDIKKEQEQEREKDGILRGSNSKAIMASA